MKQETQKKDQQISTPNHSPLPRVSRTLKDSSSLDQTNGNFSRISRIRRPIFPINKSKEKDQVEEPKIVIDDQARAARTVEQYARVRRHTDSKDDLEKRLSASENLVKELKSEVLNLKAQLENLQNCNVVLERQNKQLGLSLSSAEAKIQQLQAEKTCKEVQISDFKDVRKVIADKLDLHPVKNGGNSKAETFSKLRTLEHKYVENQHKAQFTVPLQTPLQRGPPPPPPPPPSKIKATQKETSIVELYHSINKRVSKKVHLGNESCSSPIANSKAHNSIVDELQNRSSHLLAIKADIEKKGDFINRLIHTIQSTTFASIDDALCFVEWLDAQLATLADERAVLKHFNWPERKADALREASFEYRDLKKLLYDVCSFKDNSHISCEQTLKKITTLLDKSEQSVQRLTRLRDTNMALYKECKIPIEWMLDSGMVSKIKMASGKLARAYIKRVSAELETTGNSGESEIKQEALVLQGVRFAYRAYQFSGGLDCETMREFEELRNRVQLHV